MSEELDTTRLIGTSEACMVAGGMSGEKLRRRILNGEIKGTLIAGRWMVDRDSLADYIAKRAEK